MTTSSGVPSSNLITLLGQELYKNYFGTGEDRSILPHSVVGGAADIDKTKRDPQSITFS